MEVQLQMCGISAVYNSNHALTKAFNILLKQENRGKDATGLAYIYNGRLNVLKKAKPPSEFQQFIEHLDDSGVLVSIGHNRQATTNIKEKHLDTEAHPFLSEDKSFALVHNGQVSSYELIRELLTTIDHRFSSKVDSEVYVHLLEEFLNKEKTRLDALAKLRKFVSGNVLVLFTDGELYGLPNREFIVATKEDNSILIASERKSLFPFLGNSFKIAKPSFNSDNNVVRIFQDKNGKIEALFYGNWELEKVELPEGFIVNREITCDFCKSFGYCEAFELNGRTKDRCVNCFKKNVTELPVQSPVVYLEGKKAAKPIKQYQTCSGYEHKVAFNKMLYCVYCGLHYCKGCFRDPRKHMCTRLHPGIEGYRTLNFDEWDYIA